MPALYLHVPFCVKKCPYCDFFSVPGHAAFLEAYPDLLRRELECAADSGLWQGPLETVFFGGGTPSLLSPHAIGAILERAETLFGFAPGAEISLEANPGTVTPASLRGYRAAGVNRLSLGVQSMRADDLERLGRIHSPLEARRAVAGARAAGFGNLACDLIFALPRQTVTGLEEEIERYLDLAPEHLSCYGLTIEEGTPFAGLLRQGALPAPDEERFADQFHRLHERLAEAGYRHYEISNYALSGRECRHNLRYWRRRPFLGVGAGAHSFVATGWGERREVPPDLQRYQDCLQLGADPARTVETFDRRGAMAETLYLGLRTAEGVAEEGFRRRFGLGVGEAFPAAVARAGAHLRRSGGRWRLDLEGWLLFDYFIRDFLP